MRFTSVGRPATCSNLIAVHFADLLDGPDQDINIMITVLHCYTYNTQSIYPASWCLAGGACKTRGLSPARELQRAILHARASSSC